MKLFHRIAATFLAAAALLLPQLAFAQAEASIGIPAQSASSILGSIGLLILFPIVIVLVFYIFAVVCLMRIGDKLNTPHSWLAIFPFTVQFYTALMAKKSIWWGLVILLLPFIGGMINRSVYMIFSLAALGITTYLWMNITQSLGFSKWLGFCIWIPGVNLIIIIYLAFAAPRQGPPTVSSQPQPQQ
ncbi:MAG: hypothetical protein A2848_00860 [Candidatus Magasanikbacteria bacterium RIFCSPHIGHO2_01_FULL_50_8]|uniref:DUF805 domain-containing protein n=2 Tax=Candidatus Magasanikiibacteriota TaxID=1752731 RepID=A0A1F6LVH2_9BACT|nr:MAG: hypothetical protein A2848_00860 [Candidatus Magasanikbacteria bacterium RIFCSPHIGHO2_01_FULL_50_8]OGH67582.1 MAG: hypothetical protein A3C15_04030 [Candidatus Magasanikbacteria bacterium RIFCSPHIGHO2_02_FULL_50_9b]